MYIQYGNELILVDDNSDELKHFGVLGMPWGIHKGKIATTYAKAKTKSKKLENKLTYATNRAKRREAIYRRKGSRRHWTDHGVVSEEKALRKYNKAKAKQMKLERKSERWGELTAKAFRNYDTDKLDSVMVDNGRKIIAIAGADFLDYRIIPDLPRKSALNRRT